MARDTDISPSESNLDPWRLNGLQSDLHANYELNLALATGADLEFKALARTVSIQIHKINANVSAITKLVDLLGTARDNPDLRHKL